MGSLPEPARKERLRCRQVRVLPEVPEAFFERPGPPDLEITAQQLAKGPALLRTQIARAPQPEILGPRQPRVARAPQQAMLGPSHFIDGLMQMPDDVKLVIHDLCVALGDVGAHGSQSGSGEARFRGYHQGTSA